MDKQELKKIVAEVEKENSLCQQRTLGHSNISLKDNWKERSVCLISIGSLYFESD
jgi:hypothetical protein